MPLAVNLGAQSVRLYGIRLCDKVFARTGLHDRDARAAGLDPVQMAAQSSFQHLFFAGFDWMKAHLNRPEHTARHIAQLH